MNETTKQGVPIWFMIVSAVFLLWNLFGLAVFGMVMTTYTSKESLQEAGLNDEQVNLMLGTPTWVNVAFGVAVIFGVLGCIALLSKKKVAIPLLVISLLGVLAQNTYVYFLSDTVKVMGVGATPMVIASAVALVPLAMFGAKRGWLI